MNKKARLNYIHALSSQVERKKMYKAKKQWVVAGISFLVAMGMGAIGSHLTTHADTIQAKAQTTLPINKGSQSKQIGSAANNLHKKLIGNAALQINQKPQVSGSNTQAPSAKASATPASSKVSGSQVSSSNAKSSVNSNVATSGSSKVNVDLEVAPKVNSTEIGSNSISNLSTVKSNNKNKPLMLFNLTSHNLQSQSHIPTYATGKWGTATWSFNNGKLTIANGKLTTNVPLAFWTSEPGRHLNSGGSYTNNVFGTYVKNIIVDNAIAPQNMTSMFAGIKGNGPFDDVQTIDLSGLDTSGTTNMRDLFHGDQYLTNIKFGKFNTNSVSDMAGMFDDDASINSLDLSSFNTQNVNNYYDMFWDTPSLVSLDLSNFQLKPTAYTGGMFDITSSNGWSVRRPNKLKELILSPSFRNQKNLNSNNLYVSGLNINNETIGNKPETNNIPELSNQSTKKLSSDWASVTSDPGDWINTVNDKKYNIILHDELGGSDTTLYNITGLPNAQYIHVSPTQLASAGNYQIAPNASYDARKSSDSKYNGNYVLNVLNMNNVAHSGNWGSATWIILRNNGELLLQDGSLEHNNVPLQLSQLASSVYSIGTKQVIAPADSSNMLQDFTNANDINLSGMNFEHTYNVKNILPNNTNADVNYPNSFDTALDTQEIDDNNTENNESSDVDRDLLTGIIHGVNSEIISDNTKIGQLKVTSSDSVAINSAKGIISTAMANAAQAWKFGAGSNINDASPVILNDISQASLANSAYASAVNASLDNSLSANASNASTTANANAISISNLQGDINKINDLSDTGTSLFSNINDLKQATVGAFFVDKATGKVINGENNQPIQIGRVGTMSAQDLLDAVPKGYSLTKGQNIHLAGHLAPTQLGATKSPMLLLGTSQEDTNSSANPDTSTSPVIYVDGNYAQYYGTITINFNENGVNKPVKVHYQTPTEQVGNNSDKINVFTPSNFENKQNFTFNQSGIAFTGNQSFSDNTNNHFKISDTPSDNNGVISINGSNVTGSNANKPSSFSDNFTLNATPQSVNDTVNYVLSGNNIPSGYNGRFGTISSASVSGIYGDSIASSSFSAPSGYSIVDSSNNSYNGSTNTIQIAPNSESLDVIYQDNNGVIISNGSSNSTSSADISNLYYGESLSSGNLDANTPNGYSAANTSASYFVKDGSQSTTVDVNGKHESDSLTVDIIKKDGSKQVGSSNSTSTVSGTVGTSYSVKASDFKPNGYGVSGNDSSTGMFEPNGIDPSSVVFNYDAQNGGTITVDFINQANSKVASSVINGKVDESGAISTIPSGYSEASSQSNSYTITTSDQSKNIHVIGESASDIINQHNGNKKPTPIEPPITPQKPSSDTKPINSDTNPLNPKNNNTDATNAKHGFATINIIEQTNDKTPKITNEYAITVNALDYTQNHEIGDNYTITASDTGIAPSGYNYDHQQKLAGYIKNDGSLSNGVGTFYYTINSQKIAPITVTFNNQHGVKVGSDKLSANTLAAIGGVGKVFNLINYLTAPADYHFHSTSPYWIKIQQQTSNLKMVSLSFTIANPAADAAETNDNKKVTSDSSAVTNDAQKASGFITSSTGSSAKSTINSDISKINQASSAIQNDMNKGTSQASSEANSDESMAASAYSDASKVASSVTSSAQSSIASVSASSSVANLASLVANDVKSNQPTNTGATSLTSDEEEAIANDIDGNIKSTTSVVTNTVVDHSALDSLTNEVANNNSEINSLANKPTPTATVNYNNFDNLIDQGIDRLENTINTDFKATIHHTATVKTTNEPITRGFKQVKKHIRWIMITKPVKLYNKHGEARTLRPSKVTLDVHSVYKAHGHFVFKVSYHHHTYFMADNHSTFKNAYLAQGKFAGRRVRVTKPVYEFRHKDHDIVKLLHKGSALRIRRVVKIGNFNMTRIQLSNGNWISANKNYIKVL